MALKKVSEQIVAKVADEKEFTLRKVEGNKYTVTHNRSGETRELYDMGDGVMVEAEDGTFSRYAAPAPAYKRQSSPMSGDRGSNVDYSDGLCTPSRSHVTTRRPDTSTEFPTAVIFIIVISVALAIGGIIWMGSW